MRAHFSESIAYLPRCYQPSDPSRGVDAAAVARRMRTCRRTDRSSSRSTTATSSIRDSMHRMFAVLRAVPDAVLWLLSGTRRRDERLRTAAHAERHRSDAPRVHAQAAPRGISRAVSSRGFVSGHEAVQRAYDRVRCDLGGLPRAHRSGHYVRGARRRQHQRASRHAAAQRRR